MALSDANLLIALKNVMPGGFIAGASDDRLLGYADLIINDINWFPPVTLYDRTNYPDQWVQTIVLGSNMFAQLFKQMDATLMDFNYNDSGLSVNVDQVGKIQIAHVNMLNIYKQQAEFIKKSLICGMGVGVGTPKFQSQIGSFLKIALGSSFAWNSVPSGGTAGGY